MSRHPAQVRQALALPFSHPATAPLWLALRIYLGSVWLQFGWAKLRGGWMGGDAMTGMLRAVADGFTPAPVPAYRYVARGILELGLDGWLGTALPILEIALALAFLAGVMLVPVAIAASLLNVNLILSGFAAWQFDGRIIALQVLLMAGWRVAGRLGFARVAAVRLRPAGRPRHA